VKTRRACSNLGIEVSCDPKILGVSWRDTIELGSGLMEDVWGGMIIGWPA